VSKQKKQHFVPQFYLRNFSGDPNRNTVALYVIQTGKHVPAAPIKGQAYEDYLYGQGGVEDALGKLEAAASPLITAAITGNTLPALGSDGHHALLTFVLFQGARTPAMAAMINEQTEKLARTVAQGLPDLKGEAESIRACDPGAPVMALRVATELRRFVLDLRWKLLENRTARLFITSDNPAVHYNQFLESRNRIGGNTGLDARGLQFFLPLGPRHLLMLYDGAVYRVGGRRHLETHIEVTQEADVRTLNVLQ
jgi:hypothetical protein